MIIVIVKSASNGMKKRWQCSQRFLKILFIQTKTSTIPESAKIERAKGLDCTPHTGAATSVSETNKF